MKYRYINPDSTCRRCCTSEETMTHLFFECDYAQAVWRALGIPNPRLYDPSVGFLDKIKDLFFFNTSNQVTSFSQLPFWILWRLWKNRNLLVFQRKHIPWITCLSQANRDATEWIDAISYTNSVNGLHCSTHQEHAHWEKPPPQWIKCNYDGSFRNSETKAKAGWIIRDSNGKYL